jgi:hypothetical protein
MGETIIEEVVDEVAIDSKVTPYPSWHLLYPQHAVGHNVSGRLAGTDWQGMFHAQLIIPIAARTQEGAQKLIDMIKARGADAATLAIPLKRWGFLQAGICYTFLACKHATLWKHKGNFSGNPIPSLPQARGIWSMMNSAISQKSATVVSRSMWQDLKIIVVSLWSIAQSTVTHLPSLVQVCKCGTQWSP